MMNTERRIWLAQEIERTRIESSPAWEGFEVLQEAQLGDVLFRVQPGFAVAMLRCFDPAHVDERLDEVIAQVEKTVKWCLWVILPSSQPSDLAERLIARNFSLNMEWDGLAMDDLSQEWLCNPDVQIESLSWDNVDEYAKQCSGSNDPQHQARVFSNAHRYLQTSPRQVQIFVARLDGVVAGYAVLRIEPNKVANLCNALTAPEFRRRGVYTSLVAHRLTLAREAGCTAAIIMARTTTSSPILVKRGFVPVCCVSGYTRKHPR